MRRGCTAGDEKKTDLLKGLPGAAERLTLFQADIYDAATFEPAIQGCEFVFLVATPMMHDPSNTKVTSRKSKDECKFCSAGCTSFLITKIKQVCLNPDRPE